ncbi:hypothetical protein AAF712_012614 [Marasmius tenuissimus]|uniref:F-box domain-containing protein n=1 Tax=Marasmius tenuissimus TaxID=585030 RepID=A0ABR2ZGA0_9AGAR
MNSVTSSQSTLQILKFPTELVVLVLSYLPAPDIARFSQTGRLAHGIVSSSATLSYLRHLLLYKAVDNPDNRLSHAEKLSLLYKQRHAWLQGTPSFTLTVPIKFPEASIYDLSSGTYYLGAVDRRKLKYLDLPRSPSDVVQWKEFKPTGQDAKIIDFASNRYEHDMICVVTGESVTIGQLFPMVNLKLSIYQFSTGQPHPLAKQPILNLMGPESDWGAPAVYCEIAGDYIALVTNFRRGVLAPCVNVFHWKTGKNLMKKHGSDTYEGVVFLNENTLLIPQLSDDVLEIWRIPALGEPAPKHPLCSLRLFSVSQGSAIQYISCRSDPNPNTTGASLKTNSPFYASADDSVVLLHVWIRSGMFMQDASLVTLVVHRKALAELQPASRADDGTPIPTPWSEWAPSIVHCFHGSGSLTNRWITEACGQRFAMIRRDGPGEEADDDDPDDGFLRSPSPVSVMIYDYDPDNIRMVELEMEKDSEEQREHRNTYGPIVRRGPHGLPEETHDAFSEEIITNLPFVESRTKEKYDFDSVMLDQERVIGLKVNEDTNSVGILYFG